MILFVLFVNLSLSDILSQPAIDHAHYGIYILNLENDSVVYSYNSNKLFMPASNMKLLTSAAGLYFLGPQHRFKTRLAIKGKIINNRLYGDIVIIGEGDADFSLEDLEEFVVTIKKIGIRDIFGDIVIVDDYFSPERLPIGWAWHYLDARYAPEISSLCLNRNVIAVNIEAAGIDDYARVTITPKTRYVKLINRMRTKLGEDSIIIYRRPEANIIFVDGAIGRGHKKKIEVAVKDPAMFLGTYFKERLEEQKVKIEGRVSRKKGYSYFNIDSTYQIIDSIVSPPLIEILREMDVESVNLYAEALIKSLGSIYYKEGSFESGLKMLKNLLVRSGVDTASVSLWDGSGLSRHNLLSPYQLVLLLRYIYHSRIFDDFYHLLPVPGEGTLEYRFNNFNDSLRAKTGTLYAVSCLSGYFKIENDLYGFSMMFNHFTCPNRDIQKIEQELLETVVDYLKNRNGHNGPR